MAYFHQPAARQPFLRAPGIVIGLIALLIAIEAAVQYLVPARAEEIFYLYGLVPARYSNAFLAAHHLNGGSLFEKALPFFTYIFLHGGWTHVLANSIWLLPFGSIVAQRFGTWLFLLLFILCGIAGAALYLALNWGSPAPLIGASAAVSGLMAVAFRMMAATPDGRLAPLFSAQVAIWSAAWIGINIVAGVTGMGTGSPVQIVAWQAHLGGYFAGLILAGPLDRLRFRRINHVAGRAGGPGA
jgi:membrane associated rhomboid family serine protease